MSAVPLRRMGAAARSAADAGTPAMAGSVERAAGTSGRRHWAEARVQRWLEGRGWTTLDANVVSRAGELDLVMRDGDVIVFVEVRQRRRETHGGAGESLDPRKVARVRRAAAAWLAARGAHERPVRFDAALVRGDPEAARVRLVHDAF